MFLFCLCSYFSDSYFLLFVNSFWFFSITFCLFLLLRCLVIWFLFFFLTSLNVVIPEGFLLGIIKTIELSVLTMLKRLIFWAPFLTCFSLVFAPNFLSHFFSYSVNSPLSFPLLFVSFFCYATQSFFFFFSNNRFESSRHCFWAHIWSFFQKLSLSILYCYFGELFHYLCLSFCLCILSSFYDNPKPSSDVSSCSVWVFILLRFLSLKVYHSLRFSYFFLLWR